MEPSTEAIRDAIIEAALPALSFEGWGREMLGRAAIQAGYEPAMVRAVFPGGVAQAAAHFSDLADRKTLKKLSSVDLSLLRIRDRIRLGVLTRLALLRPDRDAVRVSLSWWLGTLRCAGGARALWRTADRIWLWAGDESQDYNYYTKRFLLSGVIATTTLVWLEDSSADLEKTKAFLDRRIENVMQSGKMIGRVRGFFKGKTGSKVS